MNQIEEKKKLELKNVLFFRKKLEQNEIEAKINQMAKYMEQQGLIQKGSLVTATHGVETIDNKVIIDIEVMIPVDRLINDGEYEFYETFTLNNALYIRHLAGIDSLQDTVNYLLKYITDHQLKINSPIYNIQLQSLETGEIFVDCYIDIA